MTTEIQKKEDASDLFVFARNSAEMARAQEKTIKGVEGKLAVERQRMKELEDNLAIAKKNKWRSKVIADNVRYAGNRVEFYEKVLAALRAGYQIIPEMNADIFAIRVTRPRPRLNRTTSHLVNQWSTGMDPKDQKPDYAPIGAGHYVDKRAYQQERIDEKVEMKEGKEEVSRDVTRWCTEHGDVEFPFQLAKTQILEMTSAAMEKKIFDELGVLPQRVQRGDPIVVGRITMKGRPDYWRKSVNFIVAWFLDLADI